MEKNKENSGVLHFLYHTRTGRFILKMLTSPAISKIGGAYMNSRMSKIHIKSFIQNNHIDMTQFENAEYKNFNDWFTRKILPEKRPMSLAKEDLISPADSRLSAYRISEDSDFYIKKSYYKVSDLLKDSKKAPDYNGGICIVFRLCVDDYHRYHNIADGTIVENKFIKGKLHTVQPIAVNSRPVFIQNSREYSIIETNNMGTIAQIEVGALLVGKIKNHQTEGPVKKGEEKGMFLYGGSTVVILFEKDTISIPEIHFENTKNDIETRVKCGEKIGTILG